MSRIETAINKAAKTLREIAKPLLAAELLDGSLEPNCVRDRLETIRHLLVINPPSSKEDMQIIKEPLDNLYMATFLGDTHEIKDSNISKRELNDSF